MKNYTIAVAGTGYVGLRNWFMLCVYGINVKMYGI